MLTKWIIKADFLFFLHSVVNTEIGIIIIIQSLLPLEYSINSSTYHTKLPGLGKTKYLYAVNFFL